MVKSKFLVSSKINNGSMNLVTQAMMHLPALLVILPLMASFIMLAMQNRRKVAILAVTTSILQIVLSCASIYRAVSFEDRQEYCLGGWNAIVGICMLPDGNSAIFALLISAVFLISTILNYSNEVMPSSFYGFCCIICTGFTGMIMTNDFFNLYVFLELSSIATYIVLALDKRNPASYRSAFDYLIIGSIGGMFVLLGILILYSHIGTLNMLAISHFIKKLTSDVKFSNDVKDSISIISLLSSSYLMIVIGFIVKIGLFPMHYWSLRYYLNNHSHVILIITALASKISLFSVMKINNVFHLSVESQSATTLHALSVKLQTFSSVFIALGVIMIIVMAIHILRTHKFKTIIMLSSLSQNGYLIIAIFTMNTMTISSFTSQAITHTISLIAIIAVYGFIESREPWANIEITNVSNIMQRHGANPILLIVPMLTIAGMPFTIGFIAKWQLLHGLWDMGYIATMFFVMLSGILSLIYTFKLSEKILFTTNTLNSSASLHQIMPRYLYYTATTCIILTFVLSASAQSMIDIAKSSLTATNSISIL